MVLLAMLAGVTAFAAPMSASATPSKSASQEPSANTTMAIGEISHHPVVPNFNFCGLPEHADPGSVYVPPSWPWFLCRTCQDIAAKDSQLLHHLYYCTYNPSNDSVDLHYNP
jgi:hypothetical protein